MTQGPARIFIVLAVLAAALCAPLSAMDAQLAGLTMPGAKVLAGVNVDQAKASPFGVYVLSRMQQNEPAFQQLQDATGFDPRRDVREVLVASTGTTASGSSSAGLALVRGTFDNQRIAAAALANGMDAENYNGVIVLNDMRHMGAVALLAPDLAVAGNVDDVHAAIDRRDNPTTLDPTLAAKANELSATRDAWMVSLVPPPVSGAKLPDPALQGLLNSGILNGVQQTSGSVKFGDNVDVTAEAVAATAQDAGALAAVIRLLASMAQSNAQGNPAASLLQSLNVTAAGNTVKVALSIPEALVEQFAPQRRPVQARRHPQMLVK